jgi:serine/threonine protein kinase
VKLQRDVALKLLPPHFAEDSERLARFRREALILASLNHPNIAQVYGFEDSTAQLCIVMELIEGDISWTLNFHRMAGAWQSIALSKAIRTYGLWMPREPHV